jgi:hypothetical protein
MPVLDQPKFVNYRQQRFVHPTPRPPPTSSIVRYLEAKAEREESGGSSFEVSEREDSVVSPSIRDSLDSKLLGPSFGTKLYAALQPSKHNPNHSNSLSLLEAGLPWDTPARKPAWRRLSHDVLKQAFDKVQSKQ